MAAPQPRPRKQVTFTQLLNIREHEWRPKLASFSLVSEAQLPQRHLEQATKALGGYFKSTLERGRTPDLRRWPACTAAATVGVAIEHYSGGSFWPALWHIAGVRAAQQESTVWGPEFLASLDRLGMDAFPEQQLRYVGPILMHAGIPTYCLGDVFALLLARTSVSPGLDAAGLHAWAVAGRHRLNSLDVPARRFISSGGEYSLEVVERCMNLLDLLRDDPGADPREVGLAPRFAEPAKAALEQARQRGSLPARGTGTGRPRRSPRPRLRFDPYTHGVHVELPALGDSDDDVVQWQISTDDETHLVRGYGRWVSAAAAAEPVRFTVPAPARTVRAQLRGTGAEERLGLVDSADPLLVFTDDGELLDPRFAPAPGPVWLLHPADYTLHRSPDSTLLEAAEPPFGWERWTVQRVRLESRGWIQLADGAPRRVHGRPRPRLETGPALTGVTTPHGAPVYAELPVVEVPESEGAALSWRIEVSSSEGGRPLAAIDADSGETVSPFERLQRPVLGSFHVAVRGPLGRGLRRHITVAEGLTADCTPAPRLLTPHGLEAAEAVLSGPDGLSAEPARQTFSPEESAHPVELRAGTATLPAVVSPPHFAVLQSGAAAAQWRPRPLQLDAETVSQSGDLFVRLPRGHADVAAELGSLSFVAGEEVVQYVWPAARAAESATVRYPLAQAGETAAAHRRLRVVVPCGDRLLPVAVISPRRLASGAGQEEGTLVLEGFCGIEDVSAAVYARHAPWRGPTVLAVPADGRVALPEDLHACGPLEVLLAVDDPWSLTEWPSWPDTGSANLLPCPEQGHVDAGDPDEALVSQALAGEGDLSGLRPTRDNALRLWSVLGLAAELQAAGVAWKAIRACAEALGRMPVTALLAHADARLAPAASVRALVLSGLAAAPQNDRVTVAEAAELWQRLPVAAALATSGLLPRIPRDPAAREPAHDELLEELEHGCGDSALYLLSGDTDPAADAGRFDESTEHLARMPAEQVDAVWRAARVVPRAPLDADSRSSAARSLFVARDRPETTRLRRIAEDVVDTTAALSARLADTYRDAAAALIATRRVTDGERWRNLPAASICLALVARLAARGVESCRSLEPHWRPAWADLARAAPDMAALDLVLAELALAGAERTRLFKEKQ